jgi:hypothetical protein
VALVADYRFFVRQGSIAANAALYMAEALKFVDSKCVA